MVLIFTTTTSILSNEYVEKFPKDKLAVALFKIAKDSRVSLAKEKTSFVITGDWINVTRAYEALEHYLENKNQFDESSECNLQESKGRNKSVNSKVPNAFQKPARRGRKPGTTIVAKRNQSNSLPEPVVMQQHDFDKPQLSQQMNKILQNYVKPTKVRNECHILNNDLEANNDKIQNDINSIHVKQTAENCLTSKNETSVKVVIKKEIEQDEFDGDTDIEDNFDLNQMINNQTDSVNLVTDVNGKVVKCKKIKNTIGRSPISNKKRRSTKSKSTRIRNKKNEIKNCIENAKTEMKSFDCTECDYRSPNKINFVQHKQRMHTFSLKCDECGHVFGMKKDLNRHVKRVHGEPSYVCEICQRHYKFRRAYVSHMKCHDSDYVKQDYPCEICGKTFSTKYVLTTHVNAAHLGIKKSYVCPTCGKTFTQRSSYLMHANVHAGIKPYVCHVCGKAFSYDKSLKEHKYMHDSEKHFACEICKKTFRQKTSLQIHLKIHKESRDYICQSCGKGFTQKQSLHRHERIHNGDKPFQCTLCQRTFNDYSIIRRHMILLHKRDPKDPGSWKKEIINTVKKATAFYIEGGSGYNAGGRAPPLVETHTDTRPSCQDLNSSPDNVSVTKSGKKPSSQPVKKELSAEESGLRQGHLHEMARAVYPQVTSLSNVETDSQASPLPLNYSIPAHFSDSAREEHGATTELDIDKISDRYQMLTNSYHAIAPARTELPPIGLSVLSNQGMDAIRSQELSHSAAQNDSSYTQTMSNAWMYPNYPYYSTHHFSQFQGPPS
ncbi:putative zinc finger protein 66 [Dreissena polymorpha]|uniref:C2H2-type domain-containing protein n=1 Tax=Dreissena polymorpha TaxID=45954 RepID=A0A9D4KBJ3_DREPO|nr:putative zinc finger protein 66 [Dreissena polymorpha]KAH3836352.1 hypothetical protein DPMN_109722 [Dreissena polymorpha]